MNVVESIKKHEGWRDTVYEDSVGVPTIGWGFNLTEPIPDAVAELWLSILIDRHKRELRQFHWYNKMPKDIQDALLDFHYNVGHTTFRKFKKMIKALENEKYGEAADEMLDSKWADQVGQRAEGLAKIVRSYD